MQKLISWIVNILNVEQPQPFLALVGLGNFEQRLSDSSFVRRDPFAVYLVNPSWRPYQSVRVLLSGFDGSNDDLIAQEDVTKELGPMHARSTVYVEELDCGILDFVNSYSFTFLTPSGQTLRYGCSVPKGALGYEEQEVFIPLLGKRGMRIELEPMA